MLFRAPVCLLAFTLTWVVVEGQYDNNYDPHTRIRCPKNEIFSFVGSTVAHNYDKETWRIWSFRCKPAPVLQRSCDWSGSVNRVFQPMSYACPGDRVLNGVRSFLSILDMPYYVQCCTVSRKTTKNCYFTDYLNDWAGEMSFDVPDGRAIKGISSVSDNKTKDRRWKFYVCDLV